MRLAISGSHATGKSALATELSSVLPDWTFVEEAYLQLVEEGHLFAARPSIDDLEAQLQRSIELVASMPDSRVVHDRCPVDYLAYLTVLGMDAETLGHWLRASRAALATLDAVIFVPIERRDRISVSGEDLPKLRKRVDSALREMLLDDTWDLNLRTLQVHGSTEERADQVCAWLNAPALARP